MKNHLITIWQTITYPTVGWILRKKYNTKTNIQFNIQPNTHHILAPNHPSMLDGFIAPYALPWKTVKQLLPLRIITTKTYMNKPILGQILNLFGSITTKKTRKGTVLERAKKLLERGETIILFPGGGLEKNNKEKKAKTGIAVLGKTKNTNIIPIHIEYKNKQTNITYKKERKIKTKNYQKEANNIYKETQTHK